MRRGVAIGIALLLCSLHTPSMSANYSIDNPADKITNPAGKMYNPATKINNPASNIYNPAAHMDNPSPISPVSQPVPKPTATKEAATPPSGQSKEQLPSRSKPAVSRKNYHFKTAKEYTAAAKKAFNRDDYPEFLSITEDALRRISAGTIRASKKTQQKLAGYKTFGYGLLEKNE